MLHGMILYGMNFIILFLFNASIKSVEKLKIRKDRMCARSMCQDRGINIQGPVNFIIELSLPHFSPVLNMLRWLKFLTVGEAPWLLDG